MALSSKKIKKLVRNAFIMILGNATIAFLVSAFIIPHDIVAGGGTGIALVLSKLLRLDMPLVVLVFNVSMLVLGGLILGKGFLLSTIASSLLYPTFLSVMQQIPGISNITDNPLLACLFAGMLLGLALGMIMRIGSSTGGSDVLNLVAHKWFHIPVSVAVYITDFIILGSQFLLSTPEKLLYGILMLLVETLVLDKVMLVGYSQIQVFVISEHYARIRKELLSRLEAGVTMVRIETGFVGKKQHAVMCIIPNRKLHMATELIQEIDPGAFMTISHVKEVHGQGFSTERKPLVTDWEEDEE